MPRFLHAILFDLDNTLYDASLGLQEAGDVRITTWIMDHLGLPHPEADALRIRTWRQYGTTARGLQAEFGVHPKALYDWAISLIEPSDYLVPNPALAVMLAGLTASCHLFTNAPEQYARNVLRALGIERYFDRIFDIESHGWVCKPSRAIYEQALAALDLPAAQVALIEDNPRNLAPAAELGMLTVLLDGRDDPGPADLIIYRIEDLAAALRDAGVCA
jgi:putative hydrolase of the HAD superfamily